MTGTACALVAVLVTGILPFGLGVHAETARPDKTAYFVATDGSDVGPGNADRPFATLSRARDAIRELKALGGLTGPVTVYVKGGTYYLPDVIRLTAEDSGTREAPIVYRAFGDAEVVLSGGRPIRGFTPYKGDIVQADVGAQGFEDVTFRQLFCDGRRMEPARYPNREPDDPNGGAWAYVDGQRVSMYADMPGEEGAAEGQEGRDFWQRNAPSRLRRLQMRPEDVRQWAHPEDGEVSIFPRFNWSHHLLPIESFDPAERVLHVGEGAWWEIRPGDRYAVRGLFEELDSPGEWYLDPRTRTLYFWPPEPVREKAVCAPLLETILELSGCANVTFRGFTMEACSGRAVTVNDCTDCLLAACTLRNVGGHWWWGAVTIAGGSNNGIVGCDIHDVGTNGIRLAGGDLASLTPGGNYADNNYIHHVGQVHRYSTSIRLEGVANRATRNLIHDIPGPGLVIHGAMHRVEGNHIRHTCTESEDTGAISASAIDWLSCLGVEVRNNFVHDALGYGYDVEAGEWRCPYFTWDLYPDWAASGMTIAGNILARAPRGCLYLHSGRNNVVENNILVDGAESQIQCSGWTTQTGFWRTMVSGWVQKYVEAMQHEAWRNVPTLQDPRTVPLPDGHVMYGNSFRRNILCYSAPGADLWHFRNTPLDRSESDRNLIYHFGLPIRTGEFVLRGELGPNLIPNAGLEEGPAGAWPEGWGWFGASDGVGRATVVDEGAHSGNRCLLVDTGEVAGRPGASAPVYVAAGSVPFRPGKAYRFSAWLTGDAAPGRVRLTVYSWKKDTHAWQVSLDAGAGPQWRQYELVARLPAEGDAAYRPTMERLWCRLDITPNSGKLFVDDVSLREVEVSDEWQGWQAHGLDTHSVIADPLFMDPQRDDYRLQPDSPALGLGFKAIPIGDIGPYEDELRASWPIVEAPGVREKMAGGGTSRGH